MALADTARLIASLELQDRFSGPARAAQGQLTALQGSTTGATTRMSGLSRLSAGAGAAMTTFGGRLRDAGSSVARLAGPVGLLGLVAGFSKTITASRDFDVSMRKIVGLTDVTADQIGGIRTAVLDLAGTVGKGPQELADAFYFIASAGFDAKEALDVLKTSATASAAGMGQTQDVAQVLGAAINAYGHENLNAAHAADVLTAAVHDGSAEASDFVAALQYVLPTAAAVGVSLEDVTAAVAGMTLGGTDASTATTNLNQVFTSLLKPSSEAKTTLDGMHLSVEGLRTELTEKGLLATLETLREKFGGNSAAMAKVFGNVRALRGVLGLLNLDAGQLHKVFGDTADATGELGKAFKDTEGPGRDMDRAFASIQKTIINLGTTYLPEFAKALRGLGEWLNTHQTDVINFGKGALDIVKTLGSVIGGVVGGLSTAWGAIPGPLKEILLKGFIADRTIKFLFGFSPVKFATESLAGVFGKLLGNLAANKLVPQLIQTAGPLPVFVTNPGFGLGGGGAAAAEGQAAGAAGGGLLATAAKFVLGPAAAVIIGSEIAAAVNEATIAPARELEAAGFKATVDSKDISTLVHGLDAIEAGQHDPDLLHQVALIGSNIPFIGDALGHVGTTLDDQKKALIAELEALGLTEEQARVLAAKADAQRAREAAASSQREQDLFNEAKAGRLAQAHASDAQVRSGQDQVAAIKTLEQRLIQDRDFKPKLDVSDFIKLLKRTSEFGAKGVGTTIEQGVKTGRDPLGDAFLALARRLEKPALRSVEVQGEISRHIKALEQVQGRLLHAGNIEAARHAQRNIDTLGRLIGEVDKTIPHFQQLERKGDQQRDEIRTTAAQTANHLRIMESLERRTGDASVITSRKDFSPKVNVAVNSSTTVSVNDVVRSVSAYSYATSTFGGRSAADVGILG